MTRKPLPAVAATRHHRSRADERGVDTGPESLAPSRSSATTLQEPPGAAVVQLTGRAILWKPRHTSKSRSLVHAPFLFWLIETVRPLRVVQIGLEDTSSYLTLCQALDKLGSEASALGIEANPAHPVVTDAISAQHDLLYGDFSTITHEPADQAALQLRDSPVDLMVIDTPLTPQFLSLLRAHWLPRLSERSIMLIHGPESNIATPEARQFLEEMRRGRPNLSFHQGKSGLEVLMAGADQPAPLLRFAALEPGMPDYLRARQVFARLGQGLESGQLAQTRQTALTKVEAARKELEAKLDNLQDVLKTERSAKEAAQTGESAQVALIAGLQAQIFDLESAQAQAEHILAEHKARISSLVSDRSADQAEIKSLEAERQTLKAETEAAKREVVALTRIAEDLRRQSAADRSADQAEIKSLEAERQTLKAEREAAKRELVALTRIAEDLRRQSAADRSADQAEIKSLEAERQTLKTGNETLTHEMASLALLAEEQRQKAAAVHAKDRERIIKLEADRDSLRARRDTAKHELVVLTRIAEDLRHKAAAANEEVAALRSSSSWRITAPLRKVFGRRQP